SNKSSYIKLTELESTEPLIRIVSLGFSIRNNKLDYKTLWTNIIKKMKTHIEHLASRNLSIRGKTLVAKALVISQMWYFIPVAPSNYKIKREISSLIHNYIRHSTILPVYSVMTSELTKEGMACPDITNSIMAILAKQFIHLLT